MEKRRQDKKREMEARLVDLKSIVSKFKNEEGTKEELAKLLKEREIKDIEECESIIDNLEIKLQLKVKPEKTDKEKFDLLDISDSELDENQLKRKRIQKMQKSAQQQRDERKKKMEEE